MTRPQSSEPETKTLNRVVGIVGAISLKPVVKHGGNLHWKMEGGRLAVRDFASLATGADRPQYGWFQGRLGHYQCSGLPLFRRFLEFLICIWEARAPKAVSLLTQR